MAPHLSYSQARALQTCPMSYEFGWIKKVQVPKSSAMVLGSAIHNAAATFHKMKMDGILLERNDVVDLFIQEFSKVISSEEINWRNSAPETLRDMGAALINLYYPRALGLKPMAVEETFETTVSIDGEEILITGVIDLIDTDAVLYDIKTGDKAPKQASGISMLQPCFYAICLGAKSLERFVFHHLVTASIPFFKPLPVTIREEDVTWVREVAMPLWVRQIRSGIFPPNVNACGRCDYKEFGACKGFL